MNTQVDCKFQHLIITDDNGLSMMLEVVAASEVCDIRSKCNQVADVFFSEMGAVF